MVSDFEDPSRSLMDEYLSWDPSFATQVGWHKYDHVLRDYRSTAIAHQVKRCKEILADLERARDDPLRDEEALEHDLAAYLFELKRYELEELRIHERYAAACEDIGYSLFFLSSRGVPGFDERLASLTSRIEMIPELIASSREIVSRPYRAWNEAALEVGREIPGLIRSIQTLGRPKDSTVTGRMKEATETAVAAVEEYNDWISSDVLPQSSDEYAVASHEYARLLELKSYGVTMDEALEIGETYLRSSRGKMAAMAKELVPTGEVSEAIDMMKSDHPADFRSVLEEYRRATEAARCFVVDRDLATLPTGEKLLVVDTPQFMRPMFPYAGQFEPGKFDGDRTGLFVVTPDETNPRMLREHSRAGIVNTAVHEGYPGHHAQGICANTHPSSIRVVTQSPDFGEGWALYVEEMMFSQGYAATPLGNLTILNDLLFRICRLVVEIRMAKGEMTIEEAGDMLARECGMEKSAAIVEARNCAMSPTYFCSYFVGKLAIMQLREEVMELLRGGFSLKFFHDALLYAGCLPMPFMRRDLAIRVKERYGLELPPSRQTLHEYAMRKAEL